MKTLKLIILLLSLWIVGGSIYAFNRDNMRAKKGHECEYKLCPFKGQGEFKTGCGNCDSGSDCWALDSIHFTSPSLSYDECDSILFTHN